MSANTHTKVTILGCGSSPGTPRINGDWGDCDATNPKNRRTRCSILIEKISAEGKTTIVIDTSPDFRQQMLRENVQHLDAVFYTHPHADHIHGIDDLRQYALIQPERIQVYSDDATLSHLKDNFAYCFAQKQGSIYPAICQANEIDVGKPITINGQGGAITLLPFRQIHGPIHSLGFRIGNFAYSSDVSDFEIDQLQHLRDLDVWIVDSLQYRPHVSHFSVDDALGWIDRLTPRQAYLTHLHIPLDYAQLDSYTPDHVSPAYDGMTINIS